MGLVGHGAVMVPDHRGARSGWRHHGVVAREVPGEPADERDAVVAIARVEVHLSAASLAFGELDRLAEMRKQSHDGLPRAGEQEVVEARDEERYAHVDVMDPRLGVTR